MRDVLSGPVLASERDGVLTLTLNRPERGNAWNLELEQTYFDLLEQAATEQSVRVIVVTGAGRMFCVGLDIDDLASIPSGRSMVSAQRRMQSFPTTIPKPIVGIVNGGCAGLGFIAAMFCDVRFVREDARLTTAWATRGLTPDHGMSWVLPRMIGAPNALDIMLSGRVFDGREAVRLGLATQAAQADQLAELAYGYAHSMARNNSPASMAAMKRMLYRHLDAHSSGQAMSEALHLTDHWSGHPDIAEGIASYRQHRAPHFRPLAPDTDRSGYVRSAVGLPDGQ